MADGKRILVVDDDPALGEMLSIVLESEGFHPTVRQDSIAALHHFDADNPDLALVDVMLPGIDGFELARRIRRRSRLPIIMLTAKSDTRDVITGLNAGADDYVPKPFKVAELMARIKAHLRAAFHQSADGSDASDQPLVRGAITLNPAEHTATKQGRTMRLTPMEFRLLYVMASARCVLTRGELLEKVWGYKDSGDAKLVNVHIQRLRQKTEDDPKNPKIIITVRGIGYRFDPPSNSSHQVSAV